VWWERSDEERRRRVTPALATLFDTGFLETEYICHGVPAWRLVCQPAGCSQRARCKDASLLRFVRDLDALLIADEIGGMLADDVAATDRNHADLFTLSRTDLPGTH